MLNSFLLLSCLLLFNDGRVSAQQEDPLKDFCRLFGHSTTVVDRKQYIDGGLVNWSPVSASSTNYTSTWLKEGSLDEDNLGFPQQSILAKNESVPSVHGGVLWADEVNKVVYQYGGEYGDGKPEDFNLWYYDIIYNTWNISNVSTTDVYRASWGAGVTVPDKAQGYYYGGWLNNASVPGYNTPIALSNMLVYDMVSNSFRNQSGPDDVPRAEGSMLYLPAGDSGILVYFGGLEQDTDNSTDSAERGMVGAPMSDIWVYSIGDNLWYKQTATGDVPEQRRRFCAGATWAEDRSSYNIYLYGGASVGEGLGFGDVYVLSLPSFTWIKYWPRPEDDVGTTNPHHSLSCDVIKGSQMIIMGGHFTNFTDCDVPTIYAQHGLDLGKQNAEGSKWAQFNPNLTTYQVPNEIHETIGGGPTGGATLLAPTGGWGERDLSVQFGRTVAAATRTPTRSIPNTSSTPTTTFTSTPSPPPTSSNKSVILGGAIGGALGGLLLVAGIGFCVLFYRRKASRNTPRPPSELPAQSFADLKSPTLSTQQSYHNPSFSYSVHTPHTPQGSPPPPQQAWSQFGNRQTHEMPNQMFAPQPQFASPGQQRTASAGGHQPSPLVGGKGSYSPPIEAALEMPSVRSPATVQEQPRRSSQPAPPPKSVTPSHSLKSSHSRKSSHSLPPLQTMPPAQALPPLPPSAQAQAQARPHARSASQPGPLPMQGLPNAIDPYYAQHPPSPPVGRF